MEGQQRIVLNDVGIELTDVRRGRIWACRWDQVREIVAWKEDVFAYDAVCIGLRVTEQPEYLRVDETQAGWLELRHALRERFGIGDAWWAGVASPAFEENWMVLWGTPFPRPCAVCGYDLRATPGRCPECGTRPGRPHA